MLDFNIAGTDYVATPLGHTGPQPTTIHHVLVRIYPTQGHPRLTLPQRPNSVAPTIVWPSGYYVIIFLFEIAEAARTAGFVFPVSGDVNFHGVHTDIA